MELLTDDHTVEKKLYSKHLDRVYEVLSTNYPELINRKRVLLHNDYAPVHKSEVVQRKLVDLEGIYVLPHPAYRPDFYLFRSMAHFICGHHFYKIKQGVRDFLA